MEGACDVRHRTFFVVAHPRLEDANRRKTPKQSPSHATSSHVKYEIKTNKPFHRPLSQTARPEHQSSSRTVSDRTRCDGRPRRRSPGGRRQPRHARETVLLLNVQNGPAPNTFSERSQRPPFSVSGRLGLIATFIHVHSQGPPRKQGSPRANNGRRCSQVRRAVKLTCPKSRRTPALPLSTQTVSLQTAALKSRLPTAPRPRPAPPPPPHTTRPKRP